MHRDHICWMPMANINFLNTKLFSFSSCNSGNDATAYHLWVWTCNRLRQKLMQKGLEVSHKTTKKRCRKNWVSSSYSIPCNDSHKQPEWFTLTWQHNVQVKAVVTDLPIPLEYEECVTCPCPSLQLSLVCCLFQTVSPEQWCMRHEKALSLGKWKCCSADGKVLEGKGPVGACSICFCCGIQRRKGQLGVIGKICISRPRMSCVRLHLQGTPALWLQVCRGISKKVSLAAVETCCYGLMWCDILADTFYLVCHTLTCGG